MGSFIRVLILAALLYLGYILYAEAHEQSKLDNPDGEKVGLLFAGIILDGAVIATIVGLWVAPAIGDAVGGFFFSSGAKIEQDEKSKAIAKVAQGDPEGAIAVYQEILQKDPNDSQAISEIARICCRDLDDTARAASTVEQALEREWPPQQSSFLANRLADIYLLQNDTGRAKEILMQIISSMAGSKFAANATHRMREIDRAIATGARPPLEG
jgi:tetratricopeptide (TPR) repeat protein